ncbi:MAG: hypothetical protein H6Q41_6066 [Deltaproteobacteria bacterium]|nr:hypothetical protein [Deltaproteobacteria bacterium]
MNPATNATAMTMITTQTQIEALASCLSSISITSFELFSVPPIKKPLPEVLSSDSGPTIQPFSLQKYYTISGPDNSLFVT